MFSCTVLTNQEEAGMMWEQDTEAQKYEPRMLPITFVAETCTSSQFGSITLSHTTPTHPGSVKEVQDT